MTFHRLDTLTAWFRRVSRLSQLPSLLITAGRNGWIAGGFGLFLVAYWFWLLATPGNSWLAQVITKMAFILLSAGVVWAAWFAARASSDHRRAWLWRLIALAYLADVFGAIGWLANGNVLGVSPFPSWTDIGYLGYFPLLIAGLLCFLSPAQLRRSATYWLDMGMVCVGGGISIWLLIVAPVVSSSDLNWEAAAPLLIYSVCSLLLLFTIAAVVLDPQPDESRRPPPLLLAGVFLMPTGSLTLNILMLKGMYEAGSFVNGVWACSYYLTMLGAMQFRRDALADDLLGHRSKPHQVLPYLGAVAAYAVLLLSVVQGEGLHTLQILGVVIIGTMTLIRQALAQRENVRLSFLAHCDGLTGLLNRRAFIEQSQQALDLAGQRGWNLALILFDVDHFKQINDRYGHLVGDEVLRVIAARSQHTLRPTDLIGRYGGEEFAVLIPKVTAPEAMEIAERLRVAVAGSPVVSDGHCLTVTISIGVAAATPSSGTLTEMVSVADAALYQAKDGGRNRVVLGSTQPLPAVTV